MKVITKVELIGNYSSYAKARARKKKENGKYLIRKGEECYGLIQFWEETVKQTEGDIHYVLPSERRIQNNHTNSREGKRNEKSRMVQKMEPR